MSRAHDLYGKNNVDAMFGENPITSTPWPQARQSKTHLYYNQQQVNEALTHPDQYRAEVDPRDLRSSQPSVTRTGVSHYMSGATELNADKDNLGNQNPVVFHDTINDQKVILSGHHRAATALLQGKQFHALVVQGAPMSRSEHAAYLRSQRSQRGSVG